MRRRPDLARLLAGPWFMDRKGEVPAGKLGYFELPVFNYHQVSSCTPQELLPSFLAYPKPIELLPCCSVMAVFPHGARCTQDQATENCCCAPNKNHPHPTSCLHLL